MTARAFEVVERNTPAVRHLVNRGRPRDAMLAAAGHVNIDASVERLRRSPILEDKIAKSELVIIGAEYSLETGRDGEVLDAVAE